MERKVRLDKKIKKVDKSQIESFSNNKFKDLIYQEKVGQDDEELI